jgi:putative ABC transport system permease protein
MKMLLKNWRISLRNLKRNKLFSTIGIVGFASGFSICLIIGLYVYSELSVDKYLNNYQRIYRLVDAKTSSTELDYRIQEVLKEKYPAIERAVPIYISSMNADVYTSNHSFYIQGFISTTNDFLETFKVNVSESISKKPFADLNSSILTKSAAKKIFGDRNPLGQALKIQNLETTVSAIIDDFPANSSIPGNILINSESADNRLNSNYANDEIFSTTTHYLLLKNPNESANLEKIINETIGSYSKQVKEIRLQPLSDVYLNTAIVDGNRHGNLSLIRILTLIGILILLLSVVNYINYILSLQLKKYNEIGIRKTNGAGLFHLLTSYISDITLWIILAFCISLIIVKSSIPFFNQLFQVQLQLKLLYSVPIVLGCLLVLLFILFLSSVPLLLMLSKFNVQNFLKNKISSSKSNHHVSALTIFQLSVSIVLIIGLFVLQKQIMYVKHRDLGFADNSLLYIKIPYKALNYETFKNELLKNPSISKATLSGGIPGAISSRMSHKDWAYTLHLMDIDEQFLSTMGIELIAGNNVSRNDKNKCIVNEATLKALEFSDYKEKQVNGMTIIGVVKDFNFASLHQAVQPLVMKYGNNRDLSVRFTDGGITSGMSHIKKTWESMTSNVPFEYYFYDSWFDSQYKKEEQLSYACTIFSIIAIIITCLGLWGQIIYISTRKTKEIGIRKVNGARVSEVLAMLNRDFMKWVAIAFVVATPIAYYAMNKWLENFAYKTPLSWWIFALAGLLALGIALLTVSFQSWKAATRNPVEALRYE